MDKITISGSNEEDGANKIWTQFAKILKDYQDSQRIISKHFKDINIINNYSIPKIETNFENAFGMFAVNEAKELANKITALEKKLKESRDGGNALKGELEELGKKYEEIVLRQNLAHILNRVNQDIQGRILNHDEFRKQFESGAVCDAYVISIDIRKSTSLMLKAKEPKYFAKFITELCERFKSIILEKNGVFDKFTGDGVLAFFPDFLNGKDNSRLVMEVALDCHRSFREIYKNNRSCFSAVMDDVGLGIGVDYGKVNLVRFGSDLSIVGEPVVYACRFSGGNSGQTLCNQPAAEKILADVGDKWNITEDKISVKHEGDFLAYCINGKMSI